MLNVIVCGLCGNANEAQCVFGAVSWFGDVHLSCINFIRAMTLPILHLVLQSSSQFPLLISLFVILLKMAVARMFLIL